MYELHIFMLFLVVARTFKTDKNVFYLKRKEPYTLFSINIYFISFLERKFTVKWCHEVQHATFFAFIFHSLFMVFIGISSALAQLKYWIFLKTYFMWWWKWTILMFEIILFRESLTRYLEQFNTVVFNHGMILLYFVWNSEIFMECEFAYRMNT
jgi:hypothetical protein